MIPEEHKRTIEALVEADPEVAQATCDIPHLTPQSYLYHRSDNDPLPYCGCFVGVYGWMQECKRGNEPPTYAPSAISRITDISERAISIFAIWCQTDPRDEEAVCYARGLLERDGKL